MIDEDPNELRVRLELSGVPQVGDVLRTVGAGHAPGALQAATR